MSRPEWAASRRRLRGAREIAFTVVSMSLSLIAVFVPILLMPGLIGRMFREFAVVLSIAILISMIVSLTTTPMMCAYSAIDRPERRARRMACAQATAFSPRCCGFYARTLASGAALAGARSGRRWRWSSRSMSTSSSWSRRGCFRSRIPGVLIGGIRADQSASFELMRRQADPVHPHSRRGPGDRQRHRLHRRRADRIPGLSLSR